MIVYAYLTRLVVCLGTRMSVFVLQWAVGLMIAVGLPLPPAQAAVRAVLGVGAIDTIAAILRNHIGSGATVPASSTGE